MIKIIEWKYIQIKVKKHPIKKKLITLSLELLWHNCIVSSKFFSFLPVITSLAPYLEKNTAVPLPIPELEP